MLLRYCLSVLLPPVGAFAIVLGRGFASPIHIDPTPWLALIGLALALAGIYAWGVAFTLAQRSRFARLLVVWCFVVLLPVAAYYGMVLVVSVTSGMWEPYDLPFLLFVGLAVWFQARRLWRRSVSSSPDEGT